MVMFSIRFVSFKSCVCPNVLSVIPLSNCSISSNIKEEGEGNNTEGVYACVARVFCSALDANAMSVLGCVCIEDKLKIFLYEHKIILYRALCR